MWPRVNQTAFQQLLPVVFKNFQECLADDFGSRALHPQLDRAKQAGPAQRENLYEVQILRDNDSIMFTCVIEDRGIRVAYNRYPAGGWR